MIKKSSTLVLFLFSTTAFAVPALEISVPKPMEATYSKANKEALPVNKDNIVINVQLGAGNCTAPKVTGLMLGKDKDKNTTNYPIGKPCVKTAAFAASIEVSPNDLLPETAAANFGRFCVKGTSGLVQIPMKAVLYGSPSVIIAQTTANIPFNVTCADAAPAGRR